MSNLTKDQIRTIILEELALYLKEEPEVLEEGRLANLLGGAAMVWSSIFASPAAARDLSPGEKQAYIITNDWLEDGEAPDKNEMKLIKVVATRGYSAHGKDLVTAEEIVNQKLNQSKHKLSPESKEMAKYVYAGLIDIMKEETPKPDDKPKIPDGEEGFEKSEMGNENAKIFNAAANVVNARDEASRSKNMVTLKNELDNKKNQLSDAERTDLMSSVERGDLDGVKRVLKL